MNRYLVMVAAMAVLFSGCGRDEEAQVVATEPQTEVVSPADAAQTRMDEAVDMAEEAATMTDEAATLADQAATAMEEAATAAEEAAAAVEEAAPAAPAPVATGNRGKEVYDMACFVCHAQGVAGAPRLDDKAAWAPRIAQGMDTLVSHAINGFQGSTGVMPPKGGRVDLSDDDVAQAVAYMVEQAQ